MADINRGVFLPAQISSEIIQQTQTASAVMALARQITLPGTGVTVPVITSDPTAAWVSETGKKPVSNSGVSSKLLQPYKIAVIETVSKELMRDANALYSALRDRLPNALAKAFDLTVIGAISKPGDNFDNFASATAQDLSTGVYSSLVAADSDIAAHGGIVNGFGIAPQGRSILLGAVDQTGRPLFINNVAEGAIPVILGSKVIQSKGLYKADEENGNIIGVVGDWSQAVYGTVEGIQISVSDQATLDVGTALAPATLNLWQNNMIAIRAEMEIGFRANTDVFNLLIDEVPEDEEEAPGPVS